MIRVLIVDDSSVQQELLTYVLSTDPEINVIGYANNGEEAIRRVSQLKPDLVTMDINMPKMNGIEAIREIMSSYPLPIVVISGSGSKTEVTNSFQAIEAGAVSVIERTSFSIKSTKSLINTVKLMSEIKVVKHHRHLRKPMSEPYQLTHEDYKKINVIAIGASTGGAMALHDIFKNLSAEFPPILVVQHMSAGFLQGLSDWLSVTANVNVKIAENNEEIKKNHVYLAPDGFHMGVNMFNRVVLTSEDPENGHRPSVSNLFRSVAKNKGKETLGILLTGMGRDGAEGLRVMKDSGAETIAQDEESAVIYGMPKEALLLGAVNRVLNPIEIAQYINSINTKKL